MWPTLITTQQEGIYPKSSLGFTTYIRENSRANILALCVLRVKVSLTRLESRSQGWALKVSLTRLESRGWGHRQFDGEGSWFGEAGVRDETIGWFDESGVTGGAVRLV